MKVATIQSAATCRAGQSVKSSWGRGSCTRSGSQQRRMGPALAAHARRSSQHRRNTAHTKNSPTFCGQTHTRRCWPRMLQNTRSSCSPCNLPSTHTPPPTRDRAEPLRRPVLTAPRRQPKPFRASQHKARTIARQQSVLSAPCAHLLACVLAVRRLGNQLQSAAGETPHSRRGEDQVVTVPAGALVPLVGLEPAVQRSGCRRARSAVGRRDEIDCRMYAVPRL